MIAFKLPVRVSDADIVEAYRRLGSVWKVGEELGLSGQCISKRLNRVGHAVSRRYLTDGDREAIKAYYTTTSAADFNLDVIANSLGRTKHLVSRAAREMGLSKVGRSHNAETRATIGTKAAARLAVCPHPKGMLGKKHTAETLKAVSEASKRTWSTWKTFGIGHMAPEKREAASVRMSLVMASRPAEKSFTRTRGAHRADLNGVFFRSSWEANYARYLNLLVRMNVVEWWKFEPETFWFEGVRRGVVSYLPDFCVKYRNDERLEYVEIKGWVTPKDRTKWKRMAKYHPHIKLIIIKEKEYNALRAKWSSAIQNWESSRGGGYKTGPRKARP